MSYADDMLNNVAENLLNKIHTSFPAKVISYDEGTHTCNVQPLFNFPDGSSYPIIQNVPCPRMRFKEKHYVNFPGGGPVEVDVVMETAGSHTHSYVGIEEGASSETGTKGDHTHTATVEIDETEEFEIIEYDFLFQAGDTVLCVCSEKSIDAASSGQVHSPLSHRQFDLSDAFIIAMYY